jgi:hypothetical protein
LTGRSWNLLWTGPCQHMSLCQACDLYSLLLREQIAWMRTDTPLSGPSWHAANSDIGARTILNDPSAMNPESSARINQVPRIKYGHVMSSVSPATSLCSKQWTPNTDRD